MSGHGHASTLELARPPVLERVVLKRRGVVAAARSARLEHGAGRYHTGFEIAPQRHQELARHRHDGDAAHPPLAVADALPEPDAQGAAGLILQPHPGQFDHGRTDRGTAGLADALVALHRSAGPLDRVQSGWPSRQ
jgi:hypothetical protein